jgi:c(7)-type cytochrome triheme protein
LQENTQVERNQEELMRILLAVLTAVVVVSGLLAVAAATAPEKLVFTTKMGNVTYQHAKHAERAKGDCKVCHDKLFQQSAKAPLNYKAGMHKPAEAQKIACGACHVAGGTAFVTAGNCTNSKCHVKG